MREGSLEAPTRHVIAWADPAFSDRGKTEAEMHRIFDIAQEMGMLANDEAAPIPGRALHPVELMARAYGIAGAWSDTQVRMP